MNDRWKKPAVLASALLSGVFLIASGCGDSSKQDGTLVEPTAEIEASRAAMQSQLEQNPDMYKSDPQQGSRTGR